MNNNTPDDNLEKALDDIFGNDFIEIELEDNKSSNNTKDSIHSINNTTNNISINETNNILPKKEINEPIKKSIMDQNKK